MATLTNTKIKDTYDGLLKTTNNEAIAASGVTLIEDGLGNASALSVGRSGNGVTITGSLNATLATASQPNITSVGTLTSLDVGNIAMANALPTLTMTDTDLTDVYARIRASAGGFLFEADEANQQANTTIRFEIDGSERMRIDSSGNVGINESNAESLLHLKGLTNQVGITLENPQSRKYQIFSNGSTGGGGASSGSFAIYDATAASDRLVIDSSGNVGINCSPSSKLHIQADSPYVVTNSGQALEGIIINTVNSAGNGNYGGAISFGTGSTGSSAIAAVQGASDSDNNGLAFFTHGSGTSSADAEERMRITSGGYLWVTSSSAAPSLDRHQFITGRNGNSVLDLVHTNSSSPYGLGIQFLNAAPNNTSEWFINAIDNAGGGTARFRVYSNGNVVNTNNSYGAISDAKLKENVTDASPKLDDLLQVKIRNFNYIGDDKKQLGVVAQELEEVFPSMIDESPDFEEQEVIDEEGNVTTERVDLGTTTKSVKYSVFVPMLIKAMQEQQEIIEGLRSDIESLKSQLS